MTFLLGLWTPEGVERRCMDVTLENDDVEVEGETVTIRCWAAGEDDAT